MKALHAPKPRQTSKTQAELLKVKICRLDLSLKCLKPHIQQLQRELARKGLRFRPHFWISDEWFTPDGVAGIAVPFYLCSAELLELEKSQMGFAEGESREECMRILRHEAGHAIENAFNLRRRRDRQQVFGKSSTPYPSRYEPNPYSRSFVRNIKDHYAQAHPDEDFAETFAVWLDPKSQWRRAYQGTPALKKLEFMNGLMVSLRNKKPTNIAKHVVDPASDIEVTLETYYKRKQRRFGLDEASKKSLDRDLQKIFAENQKASRSHKASRSTMATVFLRKKKPQLTSELAQWTGQPPRSLAGLFKLVLSRSEKLNLALKEGSRTTYPKLVSFMKREAKEYFKNERQKHIL